ncbi:hypothetical protein ISU07_05060 [Nocardioides islandensis]|uniref:Lipoprotein n=1 Tax=Nocardioides islandensis TaxID=433663 RepID=A0A930VCT5_9ACTN|nr:hypothetical protein [Nocardioides islandensis]MBF4762485.1 hypothetical protein [Nocardioides islandensis]
MKRLLAALACALVLTACSDDSSSTADPPTPTTSAPSDPTSSPTEEAESPEEFVRRWVDVDREMQNSGDTREYRRMTKGCEACKGVADQVDDIYRAGGYVKTDGLQVKKIRAGDADSNGEVEVQLDVESSPTEYVESAGGEIQKLPGGPVSYLLTLHQSTNSWLLVLLERLAA